MKVSIVAAKTGHGHISVAKGIYDYFTNRRLSFPMEIEVLFDFYERLSPYSALLSDFYNLLQTRSKKMCKTFTELALLETPDRQETIYQCLLPGIAKYFESSKPDVIVSTTPLVNRYLIRYILEQGLDVSVYIIVTDPFVPMYPGFDVEGADMYFCPTQCTYDYLVGKIGRNSVRQIGYPTPFAQVERPLRHKPTHNVPHLVINSGANGSVSYLECLKVISGMNLRVTLLCGNNVILYNMAKEIYGHLKNVNIKLFEDDMVSLLGTTDIYLTKPGANAFFESIYMRVPVIIDAVDGMLLQESGVIEYINKYRCGEVVNDYCNLEQIVSSVLSTYDKYMEGLNSIDIGNGLFEIWKAIIKNGGAANDQNNPY